MTTNFKKLQNGSDIRGVALEGIAGEQVNLDGKAAWTLTMGFVHWLSEKTGKRTEELTVSIGHDSRLSAGQLKEAAITALTGLGVTVYDCCLASTPAMFMSTVFEDYKCDGAIMITASHLPFNRNGFKYFDKDGGLNKADIKWITEWAEDRELNGVTTLEEHPEGTVIQRDLIGTYSAYLRKKIIDEVAHPEHPELPLKGMKIVVDAGNGAGGFYVDKALKPLGADTEGSRYLDPDGSFP
ncbi:MAG: phosphomannomutase/phosphoglucomutase, partial [Firmicutes bacterium]|nr:phosphomannomutase/phosphoglucomutase [Bacillota bacterium]